MNRATTVPRGAWFGFAVSALIAGGVWYATREWRPVTPQSDPEIASLTGERDRLSVNDNRTRDALRAERNTVARQAWTAESIATLQHGLGPDWRWEWQPGDRPGRAIVQRTAPRLDEWPRYVILVTELAGKSGVVVESLDIRAEGRAQDRHFTRVAVGLRFNLADATNGDGSRAASGRGPVPVTPADRPAASRKVGPAAPLRFPSDSAGPPSPGPASASFRPDPPGPGAGTPTMPSTHPIP